MQHKAHLLVNESGHWQAVEAVSERLPQPDVVPPLAFIIKAIYTIDRCTFVVSSEKKEVFWVLYLQHGTNTSRFGSSLRARGHELLRCICHIISSRSFKAERYVAADRP